MEKNMTDILRTKAMMSLALSLIPRGDKECTFYLSSFQSPHFDQKWQPDFRGVQSKKPFVNTLYVERVRSTSVEYQVILLRE